MSFGDIQSLESLHYNEAEKVVRLVISKYKSIKNYHEGEAIKRQYKFTRPEIFIRGVLKYINKFQPCEIHFHPYGHKKGQKGERGDGERAREDELAMQLIANAERAE